MSLTARLSRHSTALSLGVLALLAYVPALASSPGRMPADTKLYLYLDPGGLVGRAASTFEPDQFAGWVPFQQITYLWPSGPWYLVFDALQIPDWIAHRLWIGTIMFLAGAGVLWVSRLLGVSKLGALAGAILYQLSPFVLAYVSRTSLLLLPWAGLGWIVGLTVRATLATPIDARRWRRRLSAWREPALIALIVVTVGSANATTLAMIVPAPVLWIVHVAWQHRISWRRALAIAARIAAACLAVSLWWIAMLYVQSRNGAAVLAYTETLTDVSRNATGSEVLRGLGYWLFYQRDPVAPTTTASLDYLVSLRTIGVSYAIVIVGLAGLVFTSWAQRRFAAMCLGVGMVLAVGVHPVGSPSPLMQLFVGDDESGLALALRSSTRAVPVLLLGVALGAGAAVSAIPRAASVTAAGGRRHIGGLRTIAAGAIAVLAIVNLPSLWNRAFVDPALDRDQDPPAAWTAAVERLADTDPTARVLQIPGAEFGAFRWGYTTDHPLVGLTDKPVITRDLLPLGEPAAMDLLFSFDNRIQEGTIEPESLAPIARLLGSDIVWLSNDAAFERFGTARPDVLDETLTGRPTDGIGTVERFGEAVANVADVPMDDPASIVEPSAGRPIAPVGLLPIDDPIPVIRAKTDSIVVSGSGDGLIDAAAAGLLSGRELVRYSGSLSDSDLRDALEEATVLVVTDSNRDRATHWRGSQDVHGHTEPGGPDDDVLDATTADQRLDFFDDGADRQTTALQVGPVTAIASSYGEPFAYRPEDRAAMAIDGDLRTAWRVGDHDDPVGERIVLAVDDDVEGESTSMRLVQPTPKTDGRSIAAIRVTVDGESSFDVVLDATSFEPAGQTIDISPVTAGGNVEIEITEIAPGRFPLAASLAGVGFSEIDLGLGPTVEYVRPPHDALAVVGSETELALAFSRLRVDPTDPWRSDPEPALRRQFDLAAPRTTDAAVTLRLDRRAGDELLAELLGADRPVTSSRVSGGAQFGGAAVTDGDPTTAWVTGFDEAIGADVSLSVAGALGPEVVLDQAVGAFSPITSIRLERGDQSLDIAVPTADAAGRSRLLLPPELTTTTGPLTITITGIDPRTTIDRRYGDPMTLPAAIADLSATAGIEPRPVDRGQAITVDCEPGYLSVDDQPVPISFETTLGELLAGQPIEATSCARVELAAGSNRLVAPNDGPVVVDRVVLTEAPLRDPAPQAPEVTVTRNEPRARDVTVGPCPTGCWIVLGEGYNPAWTARVDGDALGEPSLVDGGFNGWWLGPTDDVSTVQFRWAAQTPVDVGLALSLLAVVACLGVTLLARRRPLDPLERPTVVRAWPRSSRRRTIVASGVLVAAGALLVSPLWGLVALVPAVIASSVGPSRWWAGRAFELSGFAGAVGVSLAVLWIERRDRPFPNAGWTETFDHLNGVAVFAVLAITVGAMFAADAGNDRS